MPSAGAQYQWRTGLTCGECDSDVQGEDDQMVEVVGSPVGRIKWGRGVSPEMVDTRCTQLISPAHANYWQWW